MLGGSRARASTRRDEGLDKRKLLPGHGVARGIRPHAPKPNGPFRRSTVLVDACMALPQAGDTMGGGFHDARDSDGRRRAGFMEFCRVGPPA